MSASKGSVEFNPDYIAGLFDSVGRVRFQISETPDQKYTVRPMLRVRPYQTELRAAVIGEFLEERGYHYDFVDRNYGEHFFRVQQRSDLRDLQSYLERRSCQLVRELTFVDTTFADEFDFNILEPVDLYRFLLTRDNLRYGWRPRGRYHTAPEDIAERYNLSREQVQIVPPPVGELRSDYSMEWIAGVYDGLCRYRPSISESPEHSIDYEMYPVSRLHRAGVSSDFVMNFSQFCDDYDLSYSNSSHENKLHLVFNSTTNIRRILDVLYPRLWILMEPSRYLLEGILPRFDDGEHLTKSGFYHLLQDLDEVAILSGGSFRHRSYSPEFFADLWREELNLIQDDTPTDFAGEPPVEEFSEYTDLQLSPDLFDNSGRYRTIIEMINRDQQQVTELKSMYNDRCQLCGTRLASSDGTGYSEVHHIHPLGEPHNGPDTTENMLVLCPNHHADFDNGVIQIQLPDFVIDHPFDSEINGESVLVNPEHTVSEESLEYHNQNICRLYR